MTNLHVCYCLIAVLLGLLFLIAKILLLSWVPANWCWIRGTLWDAHKHSIHTVLFHEVVWRIARYIINNRLEHIESMQDIIAHATFWYAPESCVWVSMLCHSSSSSSQIFDRSIWDPARTFGKRHTKITSGNANLTCMLNVQG